MGIFKKNLKNKDKELKKESPTVSNYNLAKKAFDEGNYKETLRQLVAAFCADSAFLPSYELAALAIDKLGGKEEAEMFKKAMLDFNNYKPFYDLGYHYVDVEHYRLAIPFLERAMGLSNNSIDVAMELAISYASQFQPEKGMEVLDKAGRGEDFWQLYEFYWCSLLSGKVEEIEDFINDMRNEFREFLEKEGPKAGDIVGPMIYALDKMEECYIRYKTIDNPDKIIMNWQYIQYGSAILDYFDERTSEEATKVAGGRYVAKFGNYAEIKILAHKLKDYLTKLELMPKLICSLPGRDAEILGKLIAKMLNLGWEVYDPKKDMNECLVVAGNAKDFNEYYDQFNNIRNGQLTFAMNHNWLEKAFITPDISGFMSQTYVFPWQEGGLRFNEETKQVESIHADERSADEIVEAIIAEKEENDPGFDKVLDFYYERKAYLKGGAKGGTRRLRFVLDSPVKGAYFC